MSDSERVEVDLGLATVFIWLVSARDGSLTEEEKLLDLSSALVAAIRSDILEALESPETLSALLVDASAHL